jgi:hypothetical protein
VGFWMLDAGTIDGICAIFISTTSFLLLPPGEHGKFE